MKLVKRLFANTGNKPFPNPGSTTGLQRMGVTVPVVEITDHGDLARVRCPHAERSSAFTVECSQVCTQLVVSAIVSALVEQVQIVRRKKTDVVTYWRSKR